MSDRKKLTINLKKRAKYRRDSDYRKHEINRATSRYLRVRSDPVLWREHLDKQKARRRAKKEAENG